MFYTMIGIVVVNSFLLSSYAPVSKKDKFTDHSVFREALYKQLFKHVTGAEAAGASDMLPIAGPVAAASILPPGNTVPIADEPDTAAVAHEAGKMLIASVGSNGTIESLDRSIDSLFAQIDRIALERARIAISRCEIGILLDPNPTSLIIG